MWEIRLIGGNTIQIMDRQAHAFGQFKFAHSKYFDFSFSSASFLCSTKDTKNSLELNGMNSVCEQNPLAHCLAIERIDNLSGRVWKLWTKKFTHTIHDKWQKRQPNNWQRPNNCRNEKNRKKNYLDDRKERKKNEEKTTCRCTKAEFLIRTNELLRLYFVKKHIHIQYKHCVVLAKWVFKYVNNMWYSPATKPFLFLFNFSFSSLCCELMTEKKLRWKQPIVNRRIAG